MSRKINVRFTSNLTRCHESKLPYRFHGYLVLNDRWRVRFQFMQHIYINMIYTNDIYTYHSKSLTNDTTIFIWNISISRSTFLIIEKLYYFSLQNFPFCRWTVHMNNSFCDRFILCNWQMLLINSIFFIEIVFDRLFFFLPFLLLIKKLNRKYLEI